MSEVEMRGAAGDPVRRKGARVASPPDEALEFRRRAVNHVMLGLTAVAAAIVVVPLVLIFYHLVVSGAGALDLDFFTQVRVPAGETGGGMLHAMVGTALLVTYGGLLGIPIGVGAGVFLAEGGRTPLANFVRFVADVMNGIPSIVVGIFVWSWVVVSLNVGFSLLAGAIALGVMLIPMVTRTTEEMVRLVPRELREGARALGFTRWRTTFGVMLPAARSGILTGVLVALARIAGETAPLLFTAFGNDFLQWRYLNEPVSSLPHMIYTYAISPYEDWHRQAWAASLVLIGLVLLVSLAARFAIKNPYRTR